MTLREKQSKFVYAVSLLILYAYQKGYELTFGDTWSKPEYLAHRKGSFHFLRLAIDLNLFKDGKYLTSTESHRELGEFWESIGGTWGGRFAHKDGNHYSWGE